MSSQSLPTGSAAEIVINETTFRTLQRKGQTAGQKRKRAEEKDVLNGKGSRVYKSPWAKFETEAPSESESEYEEVTDNGTDDEAQAAAEEGKAELAEMATDYVPDNIGERTEFLGAEERDYLGRTYMHVPTTLDVNLKADLSEDFRSYVPKRVIHTWKQQKGSSVTALRFIPQTGHLLLGASGNGKVMLYDVYRNNREVLRSYTGHTKLCNDICFSPTGDSFLSSSLDRKVKLWDTETGACSSVFNVGATPHVVRINPSLPHEFLAGLGNNKIVQYDMRSGSVVQEYDYHLGPVNTITFCDEDRRFVSTSDDRSVRAWEYGIPVPIKFIREPDMFPLNRAAAHPTKSFIAFQSTDNQIVVYSSSDKFRQNRKKGFRGHNNAGYAIDLAFSPDGEYLMGGDSGGYVCWWSWKSCKMMHKEVASDGPVLSVDWHPKETSKCVTGDVGGTIKFWD